MFTDNSEDKANTLLDKVGCKVIGDFQIDQHHFMLKFWLKSSKQDHLCHKKKVCLEQNISIGSHCME